jgi:hypothetical protein
MRYFLAFVSLLSILIFSCRRDEPVAGSGVSLEFSVDTLFLDTVFSTVGSSTYLLKVYNPASEKVVIDDIQLGRGAASNYRINVNGNSGRQFSDVEILAEDSIYLFIEVTSTSSSTEFLYVDSLLFSNKGSLQDVKLVTLVRDAYFHFPDEFILVGNTFIPYGRLDCNDTWTGDKPHVIYGYAVVDSGCVLNIEAGAEVHFYNNSGLWVTNGASLKVGENAGPPGSGDSILFTGDRLEPFYEDVPGQWGGPLGGIFLQGGSVNNVINNAVIKNATTALRLDSTLTKNLDITYSYILNSSRTAILGGYGNMEAHSLVLANSGLHLFYAFGGSYSFRQCTFANYWNSSTRTSASVTLANFLDVQDETGSILRIVRDLNQAYFGNCIITGNNQQELAILKDESGSLNYQVDHALLKLDNDPEDRGFDINDPTFFQNILVNADPGFINTEKNQYALDTVSQAVDQGSGVISIGIPLDILGKSRNFNSQPDLGAFERQF